MDAVVALKNKTISIAPVKRSVAGDDYPIREGEPMETEWHLRMMVELFDALDNFFARDPEVYVAADMTTYYEKGNKHKFVAPDVMVVKGVSKEFRRNFLVWEEQPPAAVFEFSSKKTKNVDVEKKFDLYESLGVAEYYVFDPEYRHLKEPFVAFRLENGKFVKQEIENKKIFSPSLGLELVDTGKGLRLLNPQTGKFLPTASELADEVERLRAELERLKK